MHKSLLALTVLAACSSSSTRSAPTSPVASADVADSAVYELAARRAQMIGWLHEYAVADQFPTDASGMPASMFIGVNGVRCPMAELLHKSGRDDLVAAVARDNNFIRLADVHEGPLHDWMLSTGFTMAEINLVQGIPRNDMGWMKREIQVEQANVILAGKAQVHGKLESVETALRDNTATSLPIARKRIPAKRTVDGLAHAPIVTGAVVPKPTAADLEAQSRAEQQALTQVLQRSRFGGGRIQFSGRN